MVKKYETSLDGTGLRVAVITSRFNEVVTERLRDGAVEALRGHGVAEDDIELVSVPGAFELPLAAARMAEGGGVHAIACLGALVRGETPHFDVIAQWVVAELGRISVERRLPVALGVLTANTIEQALARAGGGHGNKGCDAALVAIEMANLLRRLA